MSETDEPATRPEPRDPDPFSDQDVILHTLKRAGQQMMDAGSHSDRDLRRTGKLLARATRTLEYGRDRSLTIEEAERLYLNDPVFHAMVEVLVRHEIDERFPDRKVDLQGQGYLAQLDLDEEALASL